MVRLSWLLPRLTPVQVRTTCWKKRHPSNQPFLHAVLFFDESMAVLCLQVKEYCCFPNISSAILRCQSFRNRLSTFSDSSRSSWSVRTTYRRIPSSSCWCWECAPWHRHRASAVLRTLQQVFLQMSSLRRASSLLEPLSHVHKCFRSTNCTCWSGKWVPSVGLHCQMTSSLSFCALTCCSFV